MIRALTSLGLRVLAVAFPVAVAVPSAAAAQVSTVDEGSFTITREGTRVGREEFRILRQPVAGGTEYVARGLTAYGERRITAALQTDASGSPLRYQVEVKNGAETEARLTGQIMHGRFSAQVRTARGEAASEFAAGDGTVLVDDEVFHQYYFLAMGGRLSSATTELALLAPRRNAQGPMRVSRTGTEPVDVGGTSLSATKLSLSGPGMPARTVWIDASGRVLKVSIPDRGLVALRDDPPAR
jgi:hypothetical protein